MKEAQSEWQSQYRNILTKVWKPFKYEIKCMEFHEKSQVSQNFNFVCFSQISWKMAQLRNCEIGWSLKTVVNYLSKEKTRIIDYESEASYWNCNMKPAYVTTLGLELIVVGIRVILVINPAEGCDCFSTTHSCNCSCTASQHCSQYQIKVLVKMVSCEQSTRSLRCSETHDCSVVTPMH